MRCWVCGATAEGICRFCGRAICKPHARTQAFLFNVWPTAAGLKGLAIDDALWCGVCRPRPDPLALPFLDDPSPAGPAGPSSGHASSEASSAAEESRPAW